MADRPEDWLETLRRSRVRTEELEERVRVLEEGWEEVKLMTGAHEHAEGYQKRACNRCRMNELARKALKREGAGREPPT